MEWYFFEGHTYRLFTHTELDPNTRLYQCIMHIHVRLL